MATLEFFFDCSSPWTYLAFSQVEDLARRTEADLIWKPILVGGVFNAVNKSVYEARANPEPRKAAYAAKDLQDWAAAYGLKIGLPKVFPVRAVEVMRGALVAQDAGTLPAYARAAFEAYWGDLKDISQPDELAAIAAAAGLERDAFFDAIAAPETKARLAANTDELIERGGFGSPTMFVGRTDMYFGNDRLPLVALALGGGAAHA